MSTAVAGLACAGSVGTAMPAPQTVPSAVLCGPDWTLMQSLGAPHSLPRTFIVGRDGQRTRHEGGWVIAAALRAALAGAVVWA